MQVSDRGNRYPHPDRPRHVAAGGRTRGTGAVVDPGTDPGREGGGKAAWGEAGAQSQTLPAASRPCTASHRARGKPGLCGPTAEGGAVNTVCDLEQVSCANRECRSCRAQDESELRLDLGTISCRTNFPDLQAVLCIGV